MKQDLKLSKKKTFLEKLFDISSAFLWFIFATIAFIIAIIIYLTHDYSFIVLRAIIFLYVLSIVILGLRIYFIVYVKKFGKKIGFRLITPFYVQPKLEGKYKDNWFQIHYVSKESGKSPSLLRTYIKLQWKDQKIFDTPLLDVYDDKPYKSQFILTIKHIVRPHKNYLLLKRRGFTFDKKKIHELMDLLLKLASQAEIKAKK